MHGTIRWPTRGARSGLGKLLCDARSEKLCLRCSGCDMVANKVVLTGLMHSVWFCRLWECNMAAFLNGIFQLLCVLCICALLEAGIFVPCIPLPRGHLAVSRDIILLLQLGVRRPLSGRMPCCVCCLVQAAHRDLVRLPGMMAVYIQPVSQRGEYKIHWCSATVILITVLTPC